MCVFILSSYESTLCYAFTAAPAAASFLEFVSSSFKHLETDFANSSNTQTGWRVSVNNIFKVSPQILSWIQIWILTGPF